MRKQTYCHGGGDGEGPGLQGREKFQQVGEVESSHSGGEISQHLQNTAPGSAAVGVILLLAQVGNGSLKSHIHVQ